MTSNRDTSQQKSQDALIIFIKNPQLGKVKTRLAATMGNEKALEIYLALLAHTHTITQRLTIKKYLYYSDFVEKNDIWQNDIYEKKVQFQEQDLGSKMAFAFKDALHENHRKVLIIGSDCLELSTKIIEDAYFQLADNEAVIGPAEDGGYYLIGFDFQKIGERCGEVLKHVFLEKQWSHGEVCKEAIEAFENLHLKYTKLQILTDIDEEKDYLKAIESMC